MGVQRKRTIVYVDGFNLYFGVFKTAPYDRFKWLNMDVYFRRLLPQHDILAIKYFSALVAHDPPACSRQQTYWDALRTLQLTHIIAGKYKKKTLRCKKAACSHPGSRRFKTTEEKRTDVNIALEMLDDAYRGAAEQLVLVSGDSDLAPAVEKVKTLFPHIRVVVYVPAAADPARGKAQELRAYADRARNFNERLVFRSQLPRRIVRSDGTVIDRPATW